MNANQGYYSIVQYCPDPSRLEAANVGVILFCPALSFLDARLAGGNDRIRRFFGSDGQDWARIDWAKKGLDARLKAELPWMRGAEDFQRFIDLRAGELRLTPPRSIRVSEPVQQLSGLFEELVGGRHRRPTEDRAEPVRRLLAQRFNQPDLAPFVRQKITVEVPAFKVRREIPFGFKNGTFNLIDALKFEQNSVEGVRAAACEVAVEGRSLSRQPSIELGEMRLIVVGAFNTRAAEHRGMVRDILGENDVAFYTQETVEELAQKIRLTGKAFSPGLVSPA